MPTQTQGEGDQKLIIAVSAKEKEGKPKDINTYYIHKHLYKGNSVHGLSLIKKEGRQERE